MQEVQLFQFIYQAVNGDNFAREKIIQHYKPYIINCAGNIAGRYITWSDEEASIALLAFNRAIDTYESRGGRTFLNYAYLLIKRDLIDYYRKEKKETHLSLSVSQENEGFSTNLIEQEKSIESYEKSLKTNQLIEEILELSEVLKQFGIAFEDLEKFSPKHKDTRQLLIEMANQFVNNPDLMDDFLTKRRLPVKSFIGKTGYRKKTIERHRKYLVTIILLLVHPEWHQLYEYVQNPKGREAYADT